MTFRLVVATWIRVLTREGDSKTGAKRKRPSSSCISTI